MTKSQNNIQFKFAVKDLSKAKFSLDKVNADFAHNQIVLNAVVGTLVKYGVSGKIEPYLAERWSESSDGKTWIFNIRSGLKTEDNREINAEIIVSTLKENLREYSSRGSVISFDHLLGWNDFIKGGILNGLTSEGNSVKFVFEDKPGDFLELLRMPYFGLWLEDNHQLISTAAYKIKKLTQESITLNLRPNWFSASESSSDILNISFEEIGKNHLEKLDSNTIVRLPFYIDKEDSPNGYWLISPPTRLEAIVLSPIKDSFFKDIKNRKVFRNRIKSLFPKEVSTNFFYQSAKSKNLIKDDSFEYLPPTKTSEKLIFAIRQTNFSEERLSKLKNILEYALRGSNQFFEVVSLETKDYSWVKRDELNLLFDSRVAFVDIGGYPDLPIVKMMFCTKLGINFPDPSGRICNLVNEGITNNKEVDQDFIEKFNQTLYDDAVVIPINHHSDKWFVTNDIDPKTLPPTTLYPQFELIRFR